jgi:hypothetical protein
MYIRIYMYTYTNNMKLIAEQYPKGFTGMYMYMCIINDILL